MSKKNIAIVTGGDSSEYVVSVRSGASVLKAINQELFTPWLVRMKGEEWIVLDGENKLSDIDKSDFSFTIKGQKCKFDYAYIIIHGTPGEDGLLQGYFEMLHVPYSSCDVQSSALTFNKFFCNNYLRSFDIQMAQSVRLIIGEKYSAEQIIASLGLPLFVKPSAGGSSFGVTKVKEAKDLVEAVNKALDESPEAIIEQFIEGKEFTCGVVKTGQRKLVLPVTEVIPKNEFFNYESKYIAGMVEEITPARISEELTLKVQALSSRIYDLCSCRGIVRIDYILKGNTFYFLEVNTVPGMTATSFIPQQIEAMGMDLTDLLTDIIQSGLKN
ncbi:MAG TPA: D-alanine--D-alanine ligase [Prolixibacteraceae bacterium]|nr:D-alanine--D-alanine ligase [Prolixibacteraceae bacterium]